MRRILISTLMFSPMLFTASAVASHPGTDASAPTQAIRISTGVTAPAILYSTTVDPLPGSHAAPAGTKVLLFLNVDDQGRPNDIQVVRPVNPYLDQRVVNAVSKFRFQPATLDQKAVPVKMNLIVTVDAVK